MMFPSSQDGCKKDFIASYARFSSGTFMRLGLNVNLGAMQRSIRISR